jgi:hypothetical protein
MSMTGQHTECNYMLPFIRCAWGMSVTSNVEVEADTRGASMCSKTRVVFVMQ